MEITVDQFKTLCDDIDTGGMSRELNSHCDIFQIIGFIVSSQKCLPVAIATVNKYLAVAEDRNKGFQVLHIVLKHLPMTLLEEKAIVWSNFAVEFKKVDANSERFLVLAQLIKICNANENQDFNRHVTGGLLKKIIDKCLSLQGLLKAAASVHYAMISLVNICLQTYPGSCGNYKTQLYAFLLKYLDAPSKKGVLEEAGACLHYLQQTGPAGPNQSNYINSWNNQVKKLCATIHNLYNHLFENDIELFEFEQLDIEPYKFQYMSSCDSLNTAMLNGRRLHGLIVFLGQMLSNAYPVEKQIPSKLLLDIIQRGLLLAMTDRNKHMIDNINSNWALQIKLDVLLVFKHWINIMGKNAKLYHPIIFDILVNSMRDIETPSAIYSEYQLKIYDAFSYYIIKAKPAISKKYYEQIIQHFLKFMKPQRNNVELNIDVSIAGKSAKGKKRSIDQRIIESGKALKHVQEAAADKETRETICIGALRVLNTLFTNVYVRIGEKVCLNIFDTIIPILNDLHENTAKIPYDNEVCQVELYNFLLNVYNQPFLPRHLSLSIGLMYFSYAQNRDEKNVKVSEACEKAMFILEKTCQPICSSLYMPGRYSDENNSSAGEKRTKSQEVLAGIWINQNNDVLVRINEKAVNLDATTEHMEVSEEQNDILNKSSESSSTSPIASNQSVCSKLSDEATLLASPSYSAVTSCGIKPVKKINILAETIISSPDASQNNSFVIHSETNKSSTTNANSDKNNSPKRFETPKENQQEKCSPQDIIAASSPISVEIKDEHEHELDTCSIFSKDTLVNCDNPQSKNGSNSGDSPSIEQMMNSFVPDPNF